jgi:hypothetical protein
VTDDLTFTREMMRAAHLDARPPVITYGDWEPILKPVTRQKATRTVGGLIVTVTEWTTVEDEEIVGWKRSRYEIWYEGGVQMGRRTEEYR